MLQLLAFQAYNWGYAPFMHPLPVGLLTLCYGENGSGKTTYLTGIGLLLGVSRLPKGKSYDQYIREGETWAFLKAIVANNPDANGKRPFDSVLPNPQKYDTCTLSCMLLYKQGEWKRTYSIVMGDAFEPAPNKRVDPSCLFSIEKYRAALEQVGVRSATMRLLELGITGMHDLYEPRRLFNFFVDLIGSEKIRVAYTQARREWRKAEELLENTQGRYLQQSIEVERIGKAIAEQRERRHFEDTLKRCKQFIDHAHLQGLKSTYEEKKSIHLRLTQQKQQTEQELQLLEKRLAGIQGEYAEFEQQKVAWKQKRDQLEHAWNQQNNQLVLAVERARTCAERITDLRRPPLYDVDSLVMSLQQREESVSRQHHQVFSLQTLHSEALEEADDLKRGERHLPQEVKNFLHQLQEHQISFHLIADAVHIIDSRWLRAVEGILGGERFTIVIENAQRRLQAKRLAQQAHYRYWISPPKATQGHSIPKESLWEKVEVANEQVAGWIEDLLRPVFCVETIEQGDERSSREKCITVTPEAYRQEPRGGRSVYPHQVVCGQQARLARLQEIAEALERLTLSLQQAHTQLQVLQEQTHTLREQEQRAREQQHLPVMEQEYELLCRTYEREQGEEHRLRKVYEDLKHQEQEWSERDKALALLQQQRDLEMSQKRALLQKTKDEIATLRLESIHREIEQNEAEISPLSPELQSLFEQEHLSEGEYQRQIQEIETRLEELPLSREVYDEALYRQQEAKLQLLETELKQARERVRDHRDLFDRAMLDYSQHIDELFGRGMAAEFRKLCPLAHAQGQIIVQKSDDINDWSLDVRIGFDGKNRLPLTEAPLSRGQEVLTSLYLVLAALRTVHATPILLLDELVALLDEKNAPKVLAGLRETGVQAFVATPQNRLGANEEADVLWGFSRKGEALVEALPIAVLVRRTNT